MPDTAQKPKTAPPAKNQAGKEQMEEASAQRVKDIMGETHDIAARDAHTEPQKALGRRTVIVDPEALRQCAEHIKKSNQGRLLEAMSKDNDILMLAIWNTYGNGQLG